MRFRLAALHGVVALGLCLGLLAGCGGSDPKPPSGPGLPSQADLRTYFEAIMSGDPDQMKQAEALAAPGSPAQEYTAFVGLATTALKAAGQEPQSADVDDVDNGFKACIEEDACVTWADLEGKDGKLADYSVSGVKLDDALVDLTGQAPISSPGLYDVQPEYAYRLTQSGVLDVVVTITASDAALSAKPGTYIEGDQILKGSQAAGPGLIRPGTSSPLMLAFPEAKDAKLDGQITFELKIGGAGADSIGFGLADPTGS